MKRMLINATQAEELRMAMVDGQRLYDLNIEGPSNERKKANIYKGRITRIEPSLEAAFVDYGAERHGFLPLKEISSEYFIRPTDSGKPNIKDVLREGQDIVVQIDKEERGNKGAALTTYVSLAGRFIVLKPNKPRSGGVSRRIVGSDREVARDSLSEVEVPENMSVILRTAGIDRSAEELAWDLENLMKVWQAILDTVLKRPSPFLIYRESNAVIRALRDYLTDDIGEILIDDEATYVEAKEFVEQVMPHYARKLKHYTDAVPLFTRFQIESQIESAFAHQVSLPSGGSIVIDHTEALVSIDVNSARATKGGDIEATALNTNLEAADEVARQLRIRDLGGLVVIDFIDMGPQKNQREVENRLRDAVRQDRARVQIGKITRFGLLEMSRQRLRPSIGESAYQSCPRCSGFGTIRSIESLALAILRIIGEEARKERTAKVIAQLPVEVATYLLNEKRDWVQSLESNNDVQVIMVANAHLETPHYDIRRVRDDQAELPENAGVSYALAVFDTLAEPPQYAKEQKAAEQAAIGAIAPSRPAPEPREKEPEKKPGGVFGWLKSLFAGDDDGQSEGGRAKSAEKSAERRTGRGTQRRGRATERDRAAASPDRNRQRKKKTAGKKSGRGAEAGKEGGRDRAADGSKDRGRERSKERGKERGKERTRDGDRERDREIARNVRSDVQNDVPSDVQRDAGAAGGTAAVAEPAAARADRPAQGGTENRDDVKRSSRSRRSRGGRRRRKNGGERGQSADGGNGPDDSRTTSSGNEPGAAGRAAAPAGDAYERDREAPVVVGAAENRPGARDSVTAADTPREARTQAPREFRPDATSPHAAPGEARQEPVAAKSAPEASRPAPVAAAAQAAPEAARQAPVAAQPAPEASRPSPEAAKPAPAAKAESRLLPWEPATPPAPKDAPAADRQESA